jgi:xylulokinase
MNCFIGLDIGTSAMKCILISESGKILGNAKAKNNFLYPASHRVEFDVDERYNQICILIRNVIQKLPSTSHVQAVCITGASGNGLLLDKDKKPLENAVSWLDSRAETTYYELLSSFSSEHIHTITGWPKIGSFPLSYFAWMKENKPEIYNSARFPATDFIYFNYRLSGCWAHDTSTATNFYLQEQTNQKYHQPFLDFLRIDADSLPEIVKSGEPIGTITVQASIETGLPEGTVVVAGSFDHPSAARGTGMTSLGDLMLSCGTSWVGFFPVSSREKAIERNMLVDPFLTPDGPWGAMFSFAGIGVTITEYINLLFENAPSRFSQFDEAVMASKHGNPIPDFDLLQKKLSPKEYLSKMLNNYKIPEISRSIMESMAILMRNKIDYFRNEGMPIHNVSMVGGFSESKVWPQILADVMEVPVNLIQGEYAGCLGASILAGIGVGLFKNENDGFSKLNIECITIKPNKTKS